MAGVKDGFGARQQAVAAGDDGVFDEQDGIFGGDAHEHDQPDECGQGKVLASEIEGDKGAADG